MADDLKALVLEILAEWPEGRDASGDAPAIVSREQIERLLRLAGFRDMAEAQATLDADIEAHNRRLAGERSQ